MLMCTHTRTNTHTHTLRTPKDCPPYSFLPSEEASTHFLGVKSCLPCLASEATSDFQMGTSLSPDDDHRDCNDRHLAQQGRRFPQAFGGRPPGAKLPGPTRLLYQRLPSSHPNGGLQALPPSGLALLLPWAPSTAPPQLVPVSTRLSNSVEGQYRCLA